MGGKPKITTSGRKLTQIENFSALIIPTGRSCLKPVLHTVFHSSSLDSLNYCYAIPALCVQWDLKSNKILTGTALNCRLKYIESCSDFWHLIVKMLVKNYFLFCWHCAWSVKNVYEEKGIFYIKNKVHNKFSINLTSKSARSILTLPSTIRVKRTV
jgi:hypothetical protein